MSPRPRILFVNRSYWPDAEATGQLLTELCEDLAEQFDVTVIAGQPNANPELADYRSHGSEIRNARVWHTRLPKTNLVGRAINFVTFLVAATAAAFMCPRPELVVVETDPPLLCLLGSWLKRFRGCRLVVYLQDIQPEIAVALGKLRRGWLTNGLRAIFAAIYRKADGVVVLSEDMRTAMEAWNVPNRKIHTIPNWVDTAGVFPVKAGNSFRQAHGWSDRFVVMYSGNLGLCQQLSDILIAAEQLLERRDIQFVLVGQGASRTQLERMAEERKLTNVRFLDYQPKRELSVSLSGADLHLVPLDGRIVRYMMPSKLYGVLASGTPLIAVAPEDCELAQFVRCQGVGFVTAPGDPQSLANQIRTCADRPQAYSEMGARARNLAMDQFDRPLITGRFGRLLANILELPPRAPALHHARSSPRPAALTGGQLASATSRDRTEAAVEQI
jgi:colanic acid biosynthesis glycosyl transferase WcaI